MPGLMQMSLGWLRQLPTGEDYIHGVASKDYHRLPTVTIRKALRDTRVPKKHLILAERREDGASGSLSNN